MSLLTVFLLAKKVSEAEAIVYNYNISLNYYVKPISCLISEMFFEAIF